VRRVASMVGDEAHLGALWVGDAGLSAHTRQIRREVEHRAAVGYGGVDTPLDILDQDRRDPMRRLAFAFGRRGAPDQRVQVSPVRIIS
jgi:hypothetical protein